MILRSSNMCIQCGVAFHGPYLRLIEKLIPMMPDPSLDSFFFVNSGSEAIENALKMARTITGRQNIIALQGKKNIIGIIVRSTRT